MHISNKVQYPGVGCLVEFLQGNAPTVAIVLDEQSGRLRLYTQNSREVKLTVNRLLPWSGPQFSSSLNRAEMDAKLKEHKKRREELTGEIVTEEVWTLTEGEVERATAGWFASLFQDDLTIDHEAAMGRALLCAKTHFRFNPPDFEIYSRDTVEKRLEEARIEQERETLTSKGAPFFHALWDVFLKKQQSIPSHLVPDEKLASRLKTMVLQRITEPDTTQDDSLWKLLTKGLPHDPFLPMFLAQGWGLVPEHYNYLLDRVGYDSGDAWAEEFSEDCAELTKMYQQQLAELSQHGPSDENNVTAPKEIASLPFVSIDASTTKDRDDAFYIELQEDGTYLATVAIACPSICWPFGSKLDKAVQQRATSLYLPEGDEHMLPAELGWQLFSLDAGKMRPAMLLHMHIDQNGTCSSLTPLAAVVSMAANLCFEDTEPVLAHAAKHMEQEAISCSSERAGPTNGEIPSTPATPYAQMLRDALSLARLLQKNRLNSGAVIIEREDPEVTLQKTDGETHVLITTPEPAELTHFIVGEIMILANASLASWAGERHIPMLYRTQDVTLPPESSGIWSAPEDIARVVRSLPPAILEMQPKRHAGLGINAYATATSPIRRYADLLNQGQVLHFLRNTRPMLTGEELSALMPLLQASNDAALQIQRFRPRYWKLLYFKQQGEQKWWRGVISEVNDTFASVALPWAQLIVRGRRRIFSDKTYPGQPIEVRLGKINPLLNEIMLLEVRETE